MELVIGSRLHWNNHTRHERIRVEKTLAEVRAFCARAATYGDAIVLAVGLPSPAEATLQAANPFSASICELVAAVQTDTEIHSHRRRDGQCCPVVIVPITFWGQFVPALNAIVSTAITSFPTATRLLLQSLEIVVPPTGIDHLRTHFIKDTHLVVGAALPGHTFQPDAPQPLVLTGLTTPWNTLALWHLERLAKIGFPLVADGLGIHSDGGSVAGVEEVSTISLYQQLFPENAHAAVVQVPGLEWHVERFADQERQRWQERKMASKQARPARQLQHIGILAGKVYHLR